MILGIGNIPPTGRTVRLDDATWALDAGRMAAGGEVGSIRGELVVADEGAGKVHVTGTACLAADLDCDRCGERTEVLVRAEVSLAYAPVVPRRTTSLEEEEIELSRDELDAGWYEGTGLDMSSVLCEALSLAWPSRVACSDSSSCEERSRALLEVGRAESSPFAALSGMVDA